MPLNPRHAEAIGLEQIGEFLAQPGFLLLQDLEALPPELVTVVVTQGYRTTREECSSWMAATVTEGGRGSSKARAPKIRSIAQRAGWTVIGIAPLRQRLEDLPEITRALLSRIASRVGRPLLGVDDSAMAVLQSRLWPGNIQELDNALHTAALVSRDGLIRADCLPNALGATPTSHSESS
jgi:hypothetical protein